MPPSWQRMGSYLLCVIIWKEMFFCTENQIKDGKPKDIFLKCNKCKNSIILDMN